MKKYIVLLLFVILYVPSYGQKAIISLLEKQVSTSQEETDKIIPLSKLSIYYSKTDVKQALTLACEASKLVQKQDGKKYALYSYAALVSAWGAMDSIRLCYNTIDTCVQYLEKTSDVEAKVFAINKIVSSKMTLNDRDGIVDLLDKAHRLLEKYQHEELRAEVYYNMYRYYSYTDIENTGKYARLALTSATESSNAQLTVQSWNAMGFYYQNLFEKVTRDPVYLDSAIYVLHQSIHVAENNKDYVADIDKATSFINISSTFSHKSRMVENVINPEFADSISFYAHKALKLSEEIKDPKIQAYSYGILAEVDFALNRLDAAEVLLLKAISVLENTDDYKSKYTLHSNIAGLYKMKKDYEKALEHMVIGQQNFIKVNTEKYTKEGQLLAAKYEFEKKEREIKFRQEQNNLYIGITVFLSLGLISLVLFFIYRIKYLKQKGKSLEQEKYEAVLLAELKEIETKRLQQKAVINNMQLNYKNELLDNILKNSTIDKNKIERILNKELKVDNNFEDFRAELKEIHPDFYIKLQNKAKQKLTSLDFKYCVCIFMRMSSKEISELLHVETKTVRMTKYRLKQKLDLSKDEDLSTFIESII